MSRPGNSLRWGLIGGSDIAVTRMIPAIRGSGGDIVAVSSSSGERARAFAHDHETAVAAADVDGLLGRDEIDAVYICSPNSLHAPQTISAFAAGKHVLCEKPLALGLSDAWAMVDAGVAADRVFAVNHHLPAHTTHTAIRRLVADGAIGTPMSVRVFFAFELAERLRGWRLTDPDLGGPILDLLPHIGSVVNKLIGVPVEAAAIAVRQGPWQAAAEDAAMAVIRYEDDVLCSVDVGWAVPYARNGLEINGSTGSLVATDVMRADPGGTVRLRDAIGDRELDLGPHADAYTVTVAAFVEAVRSGAPPLVSGLEGLRALAFTLGVRDAVRSGSSQPVHADR